MGVTPSDSAEFVCVSQSASVDAESARRLERGGLLFFPTAPFSLPSGPDLDFLQTLQLARRTDKAISYDPAAGKISGCRDTNEARLSELLTRFAQGVTSWLAQTFPSYAAHFRPDRVSFRPEEEATRRLRQTARNDLLHIDAFPNRPSSGDRVLRVFANVSPTESRIWLTSDPFAAVLDRYGAEVGLPARHMGGWFDHLGWGSLRALRSAHRPRSAYDAFMLRLHDYLKRSDEFQERSRKRRWQFPPGSAWLAFTDACTYADLRGRFALEHSFFVSPGGLLLPEESPAALLDCFAKRQNTTRAA